MNEEVESKKKKKSIIVIALILFLLFLLTGQYRTCAGSCYFAVGAVGFVILTALLGEKPKGLNRYLLCFSLILLAYFVLSMLYDNCIESLPVPKILC